MPFRYIIYVHFNLEICLFTFCTNNEDVLLVAVIAIHAILKHQ